MSSSKSSAKKSAAKSAPQSSRATARSDAAEADPVAEPAVEAAAPDVAPASLAVDAEVLAEPAAVSGESSGDESSGDESSGDESSGDESTEADDVVPSGVVALLSVYREALGDVEFPDVSVAKLDAAVDALRKSAGTLDAARKAVSDAEAELATSLASLEKLAERGLAYARIFAADDDALGSRLSDIELGAAKPRGRRGRPPGGKAKPAKPRPSPEATA